MPLKSLYTAELDKRRSAMADEAAPFERAKAQLAALHGEIVHDRELLDHIRGEVELLDGDELQIDPGPVLIRAFALPDGSFRVTYEVKRPSAPVQADAPGVATIDDVEAAIARLLAQYAEL